MEFNPEPEAYSALWWQKNYGYAAISLLGLGILGVTCCAYICRRLHPHQRRTRSDLPPPYQEDTPPPTYSEERQQRRLRSPPRHARDSRISSVSPSTRASALLGHGQSSYSGDGSFDPTRPDASGESSPTHSEYFDAPESLETSMGPIPSTSAAITGGRSDQAQNLLHTPEAPRAAGPASMPRAQDVHAGRVSYRRGERGSDGMIDLGLDMV